jgi:hypothetical protein
MRPRPLIAAAAVGTAALTTAAVLAGAGSAQAPTGRTLTFTERVVVRSVLPRERGGLSTNLNVEPRRPSGPGRLIPAQPGARRHGLLDGARRPRAARRREPALGDPASPAQAAAHGLTSRIAFWPRRAPAATPPAG